MGQAKRSDVSNKAPLSSVERHSLRDCIHNNTIEPERRLPVPPAPPQWFTMEPLRILGFAIEKDSQQCRGYLTLTQGFRHREG